MFEKLNTYTIFNNTINQYLIFIGIVIAGLFGLKFIKKIILSKLKKLSLKTKNSIDDFLLIIFESTILPILYYGVFYIAVQSLTLNPAINKVINVAGVVILTFYGIKFITKLINFTIRLYWTGKTEDKLSNSSEDKSIRGFIRVVNVIVWGAGITFLLDNLGFKISTVIAGLGVGGVAVALAAQAILGDLFSYFSILIDKPFEVGDFIIVGDFLGIVEQVGIKTTRLRSLGGEQLIFSNTDLTNSRVKNYKRMEQRRVLFKFGVVYNTSKDKLKKIPGIIKNIIENIPDTRFDRAHFFSYGNFSLDFEVVYYVLNSDYNVYMDKQQEINLKMFEIFKEKNIEFAYPTQSLYVKNI